MEQNEHLERLLKLMHDNDYIGLGNPNAKILFIGKEAGAKIGTEMFHGSVKSWKVKNNYHERYPAEKNLRNLNHTWQRNQILYDSILNNLNQKDKLEKKDKYEISFVENVFTTELSSLPAPSTKDAKKQITFKDELIKRKQLFFENSFIKQFQIIIIFASDNKYIETFSGEVCELFKVKFERLHNQDAKDKIWIHTNLEGNKPKLVIHTRQLTNRISNELIPNISEVVVDFIKQHSINIFE